MLTNSEYTFLTTILNNFHNNWPPSDISNAYSTKRLADKQNKKLYPEIPTAL